MDTDTDNGSQSESNRLDLVESDTTVSMIDGSCVDPESAAPWRCEDEPVDTSTADEAKKSLDNAESDNATSNDEVDNVVDTNTEINYPLEPRKGKPKNKIPEMPPKESDSDCESDASKDQLYDRVLRIREAGFSSKALLEVYKEKTKRRTAGKEFKDQGMNLVKGLVNYMSVLETRMEKLETKANEKFATEPKEKEKEKAATKDDKDTKESEDSNGTVTLGVKFFNSDHHLRPNGTFIENSEVVRGTYMWGPEPKYLIRVLYSWRNEDVPQSDISSTSLDARDIDIFTFGVVSRPIATFFEKILDLTLGGGDLIRFEKPFKAVIRGFDRIKDHLRTLEAKFGELKPSAQRSRPTTPDDKLNNEGSNMLPFAPSGGDEDDSIKAFDKPNALPHFKCLVEFIDQYLGKEIQIFNKLRKKTGDAEPKEERVLFENLWMLFDSGDTIYCPFREVGKGERFDNDDGGEHTPVRRHTPQAYRVVATAGGTLLDESAAFTNRSSVLSTSVAQTAMILQDLPVTAPENKFTVPLSNVWGLPVAPVSRKIRDSYNALEVYCFHIDFDGLKYGIVRDVFVFRPYEGEMDIRSLQAYPIQYATNNTLLDRGRTFLQLTRISHKQYEGMTAGRSREEINSPVIIDMKLAFEGDQDLRENFIEVPKFDSPSKLWLTRITRQVSDVMAQGTCNNVWCYDRTACAKNVYTDSQRKMRDTIESEIKLVLEEYETYKQPGSGGEKRFQDLMEEKEMTILLPGAVPGFALRNRRWVLLDINSIGEVEQHSEWEDLILPPGHQKMVQAMVETHTKDIKSIKEGKSAGMDLVRGKGRGCIILLHGVPGVGKTSTAECVATHTRKPLYPITCGDIGYNPEEVEKNMEIHFKLAHRWGCVLLLDEADVFLAKRDQKDVQRNGLVSVFLRILEYYSGILFLTTNRVGAIDDAFRSRLHLTLYYPQLTEEQTAQIFSNNFKRIKQVNSERKESQLPPFDYRSSRGEVLKWAKKNYKALKWNGRQIRNAFQTVLALSEFHAKSKKNKSQNPVIKLKYFKIVANAAIQFNDYLKATHGYDEDKVAKRDFIRAVKYSPESDLFFSESGDSSEDSSDEGGVSESDDNQQSKAGEDEDYSDDSDSEHEIREKKKAKDKKLSGPSYDSENEKKKKKRHKADEGLESDRESEEEKKKKKKSKSKEDSDSDSSSEREKAKRKSKAKNSPKLNDRTKKTEKAGDETVKSGKISKAKKGKKEKGRTENVE
ncbi:hypothetical protein F5Y10DRAFT_288721 [Nemania abortiva]|nr:hypothetical protein F5Y10DRAFT_288721 [Nemania abortiva]